VYFQQAIARDPDYALAHAALAEAYMSLAPMEEEQGKREAARATARNELDKYLTLIQENYEQSSG
jgi:hypothetical protein